MLRGLFALWMSMLFMGVVADEGMGADDDFLIDDPEPEAIDADEKKDRAPVKAVDEKPPLKAALDEETQQKLEALEADKESRDLEKAISSAVEVITGEYPDFDIEKVSTLLKEMHEKDPKKAEQYNHPAGWEALHLKHFATRDEDGTFDPGRKNAAEPYEFDKTRTKALGGDKKAMKKLFENAK